MHNHKIMSVNALDAHDRLGELTRVQSDDISKNVEKLRLSNPFFDHPFYVFAHARTAEDGVTKRIIWQPRLTKPKAQTNSMLFKVDPKSDLVKIIWIIPARELWPMYEKGKLTESETITTSIYNFENNRESLEAKEPDDLSDDLIDRIYQEIALKAIKVVG